MTGRPRPVIAIDGPAGVGKSTAARLVAERLGFTLVDTGALYRAVALAADESGVSWEDGSRLAEMMGLVGIELEPDGAGGNQVRVAGRNRSRDIRTPRVSMGASAVSKHPEVRRALLGLQRRLGAAGGVVIEGRDIGTVVFPDAEVKVFLTATPEVRARRRYDELVARGSAVTLEETLADVVQRDGQDSNRQVAPLTPAEDAVLVDTSELEIEGVIDRILSLVRAPAADSL